MPQEFKLEVFIPESYSAIVMEALAAAGVGRIGKYEHCFAITSVQGYWRPLEGAQPFEGEPGMISRAPEHKLEVSCSREAVVTALQAIRRAHPYEEPAINVIPLANSTFPIESRQF